MFERVRSMMIKEFIQVLRDVRMRGLVFIAPIIQLLIFGYAVTTDVRNVELAVRDMDHSVESRELVARFASSRYFRIVARPETDEDIRRLLDRGEARAALNIRHGFSDALRSRRPAEVQLIVDGTDSSSARVVLDYSSRIVMNYSQAVTVQRLERTAGAVVFVPGIDLRTRVWFNENLESRNFFVPGVIAMIVMLVTLLLTSMAVVREKEIGTMEQVLVTPIRPVEFILGKTLPFALLAFADVILVTVVGVFWFEVPIRGSLVLLFASTAVYLLTSLGVGLLISTVSSTQQQAMMTTFFFFFPAVLLSGLIFPIENMPTVVQWMTYLDPLRYFLVVVRGIFLKGIGWDILWPQIAGLFVLGVCLLGLAVARFRKTLA